MEIVIDSREHKLIEKLKHIKFEFSVKTLPLADIVVLKDGSPVYMIERKSVADLEASIIDSRFREQKQRLIESHVPFSYVLEGEIRPHRLRIHYNALKGAILNTQIRDNIPIIKTKSIDETVSLVTELEKRLSKRRRTGLEAPKIKSKRKRMSESENIVLKQLICVPGISEPYARRIVETFGTRESIQKASKETLSTTRVSKKRKLGTKLAERLKQHF